MTEASSNSTPVPAGLRVVAFLTAGATLVLIAIGGLLTSKEAGMSVPDWPTTYGSHMFLFPVSEWKGGIFYEHIHRLWASLVGMLTAVLAGWIWTRENSGALKWIGLGAIVATLGLMGVRTQGMFVALAAAAALVVVFSLTRLRNDPRPVRWWAAIAFSAVLVQGVLGGLRVTAHKDELGIFHGTLAQLFLVLTCALALSMTKWWGRLGQSETREAGGARLRRAVSETGESGSTESRPTDGGVSGFARFRGLLTALALLVLTQLILGATMRHQHAGLAIPDFPLAYGKIWPDMDAQSVARYNQQRQEITETHAITAAQIGLQMAHRIVAVLILVLVAACAVLAVKCDAPIPQ
ncbi:MAG: COX15/CtaA family protein [Verrucomicrobia bacterium]|nr:COX15/CtaA family protein [Verrucomicrobiota bacterium]